VRIGIAGIASVYWPGAFAQYTRQIAGAELCAAATAGRSEQQVRDSLGIGPAEFAERHGVRLYDDPVAMVSQEGLDAVYVCAEPSRAYELVEALAPLGVHLYVSKAMANDAAKARRIVDACAKAGIVTGTGSTMRFDAGLRAAQQRIANGEIGDVFTVRVMHQHGSIDGFPPNDWYWHLEEGGPELSLGWYVLDAVRWLSGKEVARVYAEYENFASPNSPFMDNGKMVLRLTGGTIASTDIYFSTHWAFPRWEIEVVGSKGAVKTMQTGYEGMVFGPDGIQAFQRTMNDMVLAELTDWVEACRAGRPAAVPVADGLLTLEACFAAWDSAKAKQPVTLR
jgi:predicted dehydrogenase